MHQSTLSTGSNRVKTQFTKWKMLFANNISDKRLIPMKFKVFLHSITTTATKTPDFKMRKGFGIEDIQMVNQHMKRP